ncbi:MAG: hypothetical protein LBD35_00800 [Prevotellaceae bacterium]|nr:hypothetical protein [Prevotellaceae bacterium]
MKRIIIGILLLLSGAAMLDAQNTIVFHDGNRTLAEEAAEVSIEADNVRYKRTAFGPDILRSKRSMLKIIYQSGVKDMFEIKNGKVIVTRIQPSASPANKDHEIFEDKNAYLQNKLNESETDNKKLLEELKNLQDKNLDLQNKNNQLELKFGGFSPERFSLLQTENARLKTELKSLQTQRQGKIKELNNEIARLKRQLAAANKQPSERTTGLNRNPTPDTVPDTVPEPDPEPEPEPEPDSAPNPNPDIVDLLNDKTVEVKVRGSDITKVELSVRRLKARNLTVRIPAGAYFVSANASAQNMVATEEKNIQLNDNQWKTVSVPAACANRPRDIPDSNDSFTVQRSSNSDELTRLMPVLNKNRAGIKTRQAAVWIITDNASFAELGTLLSNNSRAIGPVETAQAMQICSKANINIKSKRIWKDVPTILHGLPEGELKRWLSAQ